MTKKIIESWEGQDMTKFFEVLDNMPEEVKRAVTAQISSARADERARVVGFIEQAYKNSLDSKGETMLNTVGFERIFEAALAQEKEV